MMQTFLVSPDFEIAAKQLDNQRLGKQRVEVLQILKALTNPEYGWQSHPAVNMWRGYELVLIDYGCYICEEWTNRGYKDTCKKNILDILNDNPHLINQIVRPPWLTEQFFSNHRSILLGKAQESVYDGIAILEQTGNSNKYLKAMKVWNWYSQFGWKEQPAEKEMRNGRLVWPYLWPVVSEI